MKTSSCIILAGCVAALAGPAHSIDRLVPSQYPTIQAAIDAANRGDVVQVSPGLYPGPIDFRGKGITVRATSTDPALTTISGGDSVVRFITAEPSSARFENFTVTNGTGLTGAGVRIVNASPVIKNCRVIGNNAAGGDVCRGGGVAILGGSPVIDGCLIGGNTVASSGGPCHPSCNCTQQATSNGYGGGVYIADSAATIINTTISGNLLRGIASGCNAGVTAMGGGIFKTGSALLGMTNCVVATNVVEASSSAYCNGPCCTATGGAAFIAGAASITSCRITTNSRVGCGAAVGGIRFEGTGAILTSTRICENTGENYSGAFIDAGGNAISATCPSCTGDVNGDGRVDGVDVATVLGAWGQCP